MDVCLRDISRRLRVAWLWLVRLHIRRALFNAEAELGRLGLEQVDFFELQINEEVRKIQGVETAQAEFMNAAAELADRKAALEQEHAREKDLHDKTQATLAGQRGLVTVRLEQIRNTHRQKIEAVERFAAALEDIAVLKRKLEARSLVFMEIAEPTPEDRDQAALVSSEVARVSREQTLVLRDQTAATHEAAHLAVEIASLEVQLSRFDTASAEARDRLTAAESKRTEGARPIDVEQKKASLHISRLDRQKRTPYRLIGACIADHGIAPRNQPHILDEVLALRQREARVTQVLADLEAASAAADPGVLLAFYILILAILFAAAVLAFHFLS